MLSATVKARKIVHLTCFLTLDHAGWLVSGSRWIGHVEWVEEIMYECIIGLAKL